eukprot:GHVU01225121.1.p1 GENE.GHVU01225121.1~~GHVU01225121.1.p1  ORF type:complete len:814 (-),score=128.35 GHVU01225121.1:2189-4630(-)
MGWSTLLSGNYLDIDEAVVTGEPVLARRHAGEEVLSGSIVVEGTMTMQVERIGRKSFTGKLMKAGMGTRRSGYAQRAIGNYARLAVIMSFIWAIICCFLRMSNGTHRLFQHSSHRVMESIYFTFATLISMIPLLMPFFTEFVMTRGAIELSDGRHYVKDQTALENIGSIEVLLANKNGTVVMHPNNIADKEVYAEPGYEEEDVILYFDIASSVDMITGRPIERAKATGDAKVAVNEKREGYELVSRVCFNGEDKLLQAKFSCPDGSELSICTGAPSVIINMINHEKDPERAKELEDIVQKRGLEGFTSVGVCTRGELDTNWELIGFVTFMDRLYPSTDTAVRTMEAHGIDLKLLTGDERAVAMRMAKQAGMGLNIVGGYIWAPNCNVLDRVGGLVRLATDVDGFTGVYPEHRYKVVQALQSTSRRVGIIASDVRDMRAMRQADCCFTDDKSCTATKEIADVTLTSTNLPSVMNTIKICKRVLRRVENFFVYQLACFIQIGIVVMASMVFADEMYSFPTFAIILMAMGVHITASTLARDYIVAGHSPNVFDIKRNLLIAGVLGLFGGIECTLTIVLAHPHLVNWWPAWGEDTPTEDGQTSIIVWLHACISMQLMVFSARSRSWWFKCWPVKARFPTWEVCVSVSVQVILGTLVAGLWVSEMYHGGGGHWKGAGGIRVMVIWLLSILWLLAKDAIKMGMLWMFVKTSQHSDLFHSSMLTTKQDTSVKDISNVVRGERRRILSKRDGLQIMLEKDSEELKRMYEASVKAHDLRSCTYMPANFDGGEGTKQTEAAGGTRSDSRASRFPRSHGTGVYR